ncbi:hypothetical protein [Flaviaesturariibacter aridisoli]|uniref:Lipocalin-like domain-containing protein n=1 Tax=Flaviaesturariibacter aridisoli TaxID=2545761 RepID=A0A4R4DZ83_9BACT|nr:hypothetical protein [Flaviaesturariibacter aridisoli]RYY62084.1 MAG: hypothetical protein EOO12_13805 [Chitinophagaceae bacterium]TCZ69647.1 hypothetical protein E0486_12040 [Flaviaesturariibacter aridisoli]
MKTVLRLTALLCLPLLFSCGREAQEQNDNPVPYLTLGQWKVRECNGPSVPNNTLSGYDVTFTENGGLTLRYNGASFSGNWSLHQKVEGKSLTLRVNGANSDASVLSNEWDLQYFDPNTVKLEQGSTHLSLGRP